MYFLLIQIADEDPVSLDSQEKKIEKKNSDLD